MIKALHDRSFGALAVLLMGLAWVVCGCNESTSQAGNPPAGGDRVTPPASASKGGGAGSSAAVAVASRGSTATPAAPRPQNTPTAGVSTPVAPSDIPQFPPDAKWTIYCYAVNGANHVTASRGLCDSLKAATGRAEWYVIHGSDESKLYFGYYNFIDPAAQTDPAVQRANLDLQQVKEMRDNAGKQPFFTSVFVSLETPDPTAPPEWNLYNVDRGLAPKDPRRAYWSLQIAAFRGVPERKEAAVAMVRQLREELKVEAYYYHGESISSVCVGKWPPAAIKEQKMAEGAKVDQNATLLVTSEQVPENLRPKSLDGKQTLLLSPKIEIVDPAMRAMMQKFPHHATNYVEGRMINGREVLDPSFIVTIPRAKGNGLYDSDVVVDPYPQRQERFRRPAMIVPRD